MKKLIYTVLAVLFVTVAANANPRLKNKKHFKKDFDPNKKVEAPLTTLSALNKGPQYKNEGHEYDVAEGTDVNLNNANTVKGPKYKNQKPFSDKNTNSKDANPEIAVTE